MSIEETIFQMKEKWEAPGRLVGSGVNSPGFWLACSFSEHGATTQDLKQINKTIPTELERFWTVVKSARLFEDQTYGQWGLEILTPTEAMRETRRQTKERRNCYLRSDLVIGRFLGDQELLVIRCDQRQDDFGQVLIALPLDGRDEWYCGSKNLETFLQTFLENQGEKFWEMRA